MLLSLATTTAEMKEEWLGLYKNIYPVCSSFTRCKLLQLILQIKQILNPFSYTDLTEAGSVRNEIPLQRPAQH